MDYLKTPYMFIKNLIAFPLVWLFFPVFLLLDILAEVYHRVSFLLYGFSYINRGKFIKLDRHKLRYLNIFQKVNCVYCGYANGLLAYWVELAAYTEKYWCGIMHSKSKVFKTPAHHKRFQFTKYNSESEFKEKYKSKN